MIKNKRKIISKKEKSCSSIWSQGLGLMFSSKKNLVMIFEKERKINLHNFFVFYPIDVLVLDSSKKIVEIKRNFKPFTFWNSKQKGKYIVELAFFGDYQVGDILDF